MLSYQLDILEVALFYTVLCVYIKLSYKDNCVTKMANI